MRKRTKLPASPPATPARESVFVKRTISLPEDLMDHAVACAAAPRYAGNLSAFLRDLLDKHLQQMRAV